MKKGVYAGSFDPITNGHLWMIQEAVQLFDEVVIAIGMNPNKQYTFNVEERLAMIRLATAGIDNIKVTAFENQFLVDYAQSIQANYILRGIRTAADYEYERTMRHINADIHPSIHTLFLMPPRAYAEVSSTMIKGLIGPIGWEKLIAQYLPEAVCKKMIERHR
ncbi:MAG: pantetheine-phosphate adenylyltransferase [Neisseriaceae bacterium]|nr:pantetheine-phosphate adenylyltransferase [Neisseriaceae bacterium]